MNCFLCISSDILETSIYSWYFLHLLIDIKPVQGSLGRTFHFEFHAAALTTSLITSLAVVNSTVLSVCPTYLQGSHRVTEGHPVSATGADLRALSEPVDVDLWCSCHLTLKHFTLPGSHDRHTVWGPSEFRRLYRTIWKNEINHQIIVDKWGRYW